MRKIAYLFVLISLSSYGQDAHITIDASRVLNKIPATLYGSCIEDVNHEVYGGLYDQRLFGESFEEPAPQAGFRGWKLLKGEWRIGGGGIPSGMGPGYKLVRDMPVLKDGQLGADILFRDRGRTAGLLLRVSDEGQGQDNLNGYAVNVTRGQKKVVLGKYLHHWEMLAEGEMPFTPADSMRLRVRLEGPRLLVYVNDGATPVIDHTDRNQPLLSGKVGVRCDNAAVRFEKVEIETGDSTIRNVFAPAAVPRVSAGWDAVETNAKGLYNIDTVDAYTGRQSQVMAFDKGSDKGSGRIGIANSGLNHWGISVRQGQQLDGSVFLHGDLPGGPVTVALESADGRKTYARALLTGVASSWKKHAFSLTPNATDPHARFVMYIQNGKLWVDQASLMSSGAAQFKGLPLRADIASMMVKEGLRFLRYGGTMVNAPAYRWKNMTGSRDTRPPYKGHWYPYSSNGFGIEEFVRFCEAAGFEPAFAINVEETPEDVARMVEYLTGDASTAGGRQRGAAGHPAPYRLHYIEIGNEEVIWADKLEDYEHYCERFNILYNAIHAKNPSIQLVCSVWWRPASAHMEKVFRAINGKAARWDLHTDADDPAAGTTVDRNLQRMQELFLQWDPNTTLKCAVFEENGGLHDLQRALGHATTLNAIRRHGDFVLTSCPANALQPYRQNDNDWDQGQIFFTPSRVWGMPPFYAQQMAAANHLPLRLADHTEGDLDVTATRSENSSVLVIHIVNTKDRAVKATIALDHFSRRSTQVEVYTLQGGLKDENTPEDPQKISTVKTVVRLPGDTVSYICPARCYSILRFSK